MLGDRRVFRGRHALSGPSSEMKPQLDRAYFTEGQRLYREYIFFMFLPLMQ